MATLNVRVSNSQVLQYLLTTTKPISRSLCIRYNGTVYYCPLIHQQKISPCVNVIDENYDTAFITNADTDLTMNHRYPANISFVQIGAQALSIQNRGELTFDGSSAIQCFYIRNVPFVSGTEARLIKTLSTNSLSFTTNVVPSELGTKNIPLFEAYNKASQRITLYINTSKKAVLNFNGTDVRTHSTVFNTGASYKVNFTYSSKKLNLKVNNNAVGEISKTLTEGGYRYYIGYSEALDTYFKGTMNTTSISLPSYSTEFYWGN